jgi:MSHA biogenesis protein MshN
MSLINKMLQDLDARGTTRAGGVPPEIKTVGVARRLPDGRIAAITGAVLLALGAAAWVIFPLKGKTYDVQPLPPAAVPATPAPVASAPAAPAVTVAEVAPPVAREETPVQPPSAPVEEPAEPAPAVRDKPAAEARQAAPAARREKAAPPAPKAASEAPGEGSTTSYAVASARARAEQDRLEKRWEAEEVRLTALPPAERAAAERRLRDEQTRAAVKARQDTKWLAALQRREAAGGVPGAPAAAAPATAPAAAGSRGQGRVETESQGADNAYRRALAALQDGRTAEAVSNLQAALRASPRHEAARQTLVSLLIENNRGDEAMAQLQQALTLEPRQPALAMLLARLQIERGKSGIEALLRTLPYATGNGDYHAFLGGALQRQNRFREAAEQYQTALRTAPNNAVWWMGLGIALQGDKRNAEAQDAFRQAKALGTLSPELQAFVERRLAQVAR